MKQNKKLTSALARRGKSSTSSSTRIGKSGASKSAVTRQSKSTQASVDTIFFFKLLLYTLLGSMWLKLSHGDTMHIPLPIGVAAGLFFTAHEHFQIDRKIEYAVLLVAMLVGFFIPFGLYVNF